MIADNVLLPFDGDRGAKIRPGPGTCLEITRIGFQRDRRRVYLGSAESQLGSGNRESAVNPCVHRNAELAVTWAPADRTHKSIGLCGSGKNKHGKNQRACCREQTRQRKNSFHKKRRGIFIKFIT